MTKQIDIAVKIAEHVAKKTKFNNGADFEDYVKYIRNWTAKNFPARFVEAGITVEGLAFTFTPVEAAMGVMNSFRYSSAADYFRLQFISDFARKELKVILVQRKFDNVKQLHTSVELFRNKISVTVK